MRISDWSSDVCSSDLSGPSARAEAILPAPVAVKLTAGGARALFSRAGALINRGRKGQRAAATRDASRDDRLRSSTSQHGGEPDPPQPGDGPAPRRGLRDGGARSPRRRSEARSEERRVGNEWVRTLRDRW